EIARWDGNNWYPLQNGIHGDSWVNTIKVYKNFLFVGGYFQKADVNSSDYIMSWDGENWFNPFPGVNYISQVKDLMVHNDKLYIVGIFYIPGENKIYGLAWYDGTNFCPFGGSTVYPDVPDVRKIAALGDDIYITCNQTLFGDTVNFIARWNGTENDTCLTIPLSKQTTEMKESTLSLSPNPARDFVTISITEPAAEEIQVFVSDCTGRIVLRSIIPKNQTACELGLGKIRAGVYLVKVSGSSGQGVVKLVKSEE
ncbi:MAG: T9SS type A sorting domain-containing protein, partial [Bacteroidetes bacterium]|nr:T9SS type A sorting domain-containing protein [Bacteroidota bacterium]MBU1719661.1 T9SS type A sorting domain-containing protein [Bacteroidota bacterium]